jgi:hypothetical protein
MEWEVKEGVKDTILENLNEIIDAIIEKYVPRFLVSLAYDEENKKLFVTEPYTTSTRLPWRVLVTVDDKDFDVEGVILDTDLAADAIIEKDDYTYAGEAAHREMVEENLWEFIREEIDNLVDGLEGEVEK